MILYVDDDTVKRELIRRLRELQQSVVLPKEVGLSGTSDARHFAHAIRNGFVLISRDVDDYRDLHEVVLAAGGRHPGILLICAEKDKKKNMNPAQIVAAIGKLEKSGLPLVNQVHVLNQWR